ncbi:hypothetical protein [Sporomusa ovata]
MRLKPMARRLHSMATATGAIASAACYMPAPPPRAGITLTGSDVDADHRK